MRQAEVYRNREFAGVIIEDNLHQYTFSYDDAYFLDPTKPQISLTLPKSQKKYTSPILFPFFFNMLSEGINRKLQSRILHIDEKDHFGILLATTKEDTIGAITTRPIVK